MGVKIGVGGAGYFQPKATHQFLPGCAKCHAPHPLAVRTVVDKTRCQVCDEPAGQPGESFTQIGALGGGIVTAVAELFLKAGRAFNDFSKRI